jgi:hypothetical protein
MKHQRKANLKTAIPYTSDEFPELVFLVPKAQCFSVASTFSAVVYVNRLHADAMYILDLPLGTLMMLQARHRPLLMVTIGAMTMVGQRRADVELQLLSVINE